MELLILQFLQYAQDIHDAVRGQMIFCQQPGNLAACVAPSDTDPPGIGKGDELAFILFHVGQKERVHIPDRYHIVNVALLDPERSLCVRYF